MAKEVRPPCHCFVVSARLWQSRRRTSDPELYLEPRVAAATAGDYEGLDADDADRENRTSSYYRQDPIYMTVVEDNNSSDYTDISSSNETQTVPQFTIDG